MNLSGTIATVTALCAVFGTAYGTVWFLDSRYQLSGEYVTAAEFKNVEWSLLRGELRDIEEELRENPEDTELLAEYEEALDRFCLAFPDDRKCRE